MASSCCIQIYVSVIIVLLPVTYDMNGFSALPDHVIQEIVSEIPLNNRLMLRPLSYRISQLVELETTLELRQFSLDAVFPPEVYPIEAKEGQIKESICFLIPLLGQKLRSFHSGTREVNEEFCRCIVELLIQHCPNLEKLTIADGSFCATSSVIDTIGGFRNLKRLVVPRLQLYRYSELSSETTGFLNNLSSFDTMFRVVPPLPALALSPLFSLVKRVSILYEMDDAELASLCENCPELECVSLWDVSNPVTHLRKLRKLKALCFCGGRNLEDLGRLGESALELTHLKLFRCALETEELRNLEFLRSFHMLRCLSLGDMTVTGFPTGLSSLRALELKRLNKPSGEPMSVDLSGFSSLTALKLNSKEAWPQIVMSIPRSNVLEVLHLYEVPQWSDDLCRVFERFPRLCSLHLDCRSLSQRETDVTLANLPLQLRKLILFGCGFGDLILSRIVRLEHLSALRVLEVGIRGSEHRFTAEGWLDIERQRAAKVLEKGNEVRTLLVCMFSDIPVRPNNLEAKLFLRGG